jgi:hypothetical protein
LALTEYQQEDSNTGNAISVENDINEKLQSIVKTKILAEDVKTNADEERVRFESIIDFPHFLLHVLTNFYRGLKDR